MSVRSISYKRGLRTRSMISTGILVTVTAFFLTLPLFAGSYKQILLTNIFMYIVLALAWSFFSGPTGYISLAPAAFFGLGLYVSAGFGEMVPFPVLILIGGIAGFILAFFVGVITLRLRGIYFSIFTFVLVELIKHVLLWWEVNIMCTRGRFVIVLDIQTVYYAMFIILLILLFFTYYLKKSKFGLALWSIGQFEEASSHIGINVTMVKTLGFASSAFFMAAAGAAIATRWTYIDPYIAFNPVFSFMPVVMAIFGGMGQIYGPIMGAAILAFLEELLITKFPYYYMLIFGTILILIILFLPEGLAGLFRKWRKRGD